MTQKLIHLPLTVGDEEEARRYYVEQVGWELTADFDHPGGRFITVSPPGSGLSLVLHNPGRHLPRETATSLLENLHWSLPFVLETDDCLGDFLAMQERGVEFIGTPKQKGAGVEAVFVDPWGNKWALLQPVTQEMEVEV
jgi:predicted enzyme related to lactoylglutathione lyase